MHKRYYFSFERRTLVLLALGYAVLCLLIFGEGVLIGYENGRADAIKPVPQAKPADTVTPVANPPVQADTQHQQIIADTFTKAPLPPPDSLTTVINYALNSWNVQRDTLLSIEKSKAARYYTVQFGAFLLKAQAERRLQELLQKEGLYGYVAELRNASGTRTWYLVRIGLFENKALAEKSAADFNARFHVETIARPLGIF